MNIIKAPDFLLNGVQVKQGLGSRREEGGRGRVGWGMAIGRARGMGGQQGGGGGRAWEGGDKITWDYRSKGASEIWGDSKPDLTTNVNCTPSCCCILQ